jgi:hypothetical protein
LLGYNNCPPEDQPTMALMSLSMIAGLRKESEEEALQWLLANPKRAENHGFGLWLLRLEEPPKAKHPQP